MSEYYGVTMFCQLKKPRIINIYMIVFLGSPFQTTLVWVLPCVVMVLLCMISLHVGFKHWKRRKLSAYSIPPVSCDPEMQVEKVSVV